MGFFSKLFNLSSTDSTSQIEPVEYKGFLIYPEAKKEGGGQYRIAGRICRKIDGKIKTHQFIRSDILTSEQQTNEIMITKSKLFIDQMDGKIFQQK